MVGEGTQGSRSAMHNSQAGFHLVLLYVSTTAGAFS